MTAEQIFLGDGLKKKRIKRKGNMCGMLIKLKGRRQKKKKTKGWLKEVFDCLELMTKS